MALQLTCWVATAAYFFTLKCYLEYEDYLYTFAKFLKANLTVINLFCSQVERGNAAYISGIREKYFGELFLNASKSLDCFLVDEQFSGYNNIYNPLYNFAVNYSKKVIEEEEGLKHIARFVESFVSKSNEIWLVFQNEGVSLSKMVYTAEKTKDITGDDTREEKSKYVKVVRPSKWWYWLRTTNEGQKQMQDLLYQLVYILLLFSLSVFFFNLFN